MFRPLVYPADGGITLGELQGTHGLHTQQQVDAATEKYGHNR